MKLYYVYILRCEDNSLYTGYTPDLKTRMHDHFSGTARCAKYTRAHKPIRIEAVWKSEEKTAAMRLEYRIKRLTKLKKEQLIKEPGKLNEFTDWKLTDVYTYVDKVEEAVSI